MKSATMFSAIHKSRQLSLIALERVNDYLDLLRIEMKIREHDIVLRIAGYAIAALFALLATVFLGLAIIVSFWDSPYRALAAWFVVVLYGGIAGFSLRFCMKHLHSESIATMLRSELQRDIDLIKENI